MRLIPSLLALSLLSAPSIAAQRWFDIEVVIFERNGESSSETWPHDTPTIDTSRGINTQMAALVPSFHRCPTLNQQQIEQVIADNQVNNSSLGQPTKCVLAPQANRSARNTATNEYSALLKPFTLPTRFNYQGRNYQVVAPPLMPANVPLRVSASSLARSGSPRLLPKSSLRLNWLVKRLKRQKNLNPKLHIGWRQLVKPRHLAQPLHLFAGQNFANRFNQDGSAIGPISLNSNLADSALQQWPLWEIDGLFNVYLSHYLFIEIELNRKIASTITLKIPNPTAQDPNSPFDSQALSGLVKPQSGSEPNTETESTSLINSPSSKQLLASPTQLESQFPWLINHPMIQHRRVKSTEIHYFDHPDMGIIVQIRKT
ncbi:MAG: peptidoglycan binding protein CsiV [Gammaproteobacteria bacterium]|nr:peptidoglycan binding protein CsiV [Gammaproteobacteria bacterium]